MLPLREGAAGERVTGRMAVPVMRGDASGILLDVLRGEGEPDSFLTAAAELSARYDADALGILHDDDAQLCLTLLYELHLQASTASTTAGNGIRVSSRPDGCWSDRSTPLSERSSATGWLRRGVDSGTTWWRRCGT